MLMMDMKIPNGAVIGALRDCGLSKWIRYSLKVTIDEMGDLTAYSLSTMDARDNPFHGMPSKPKYMRDMKQIEAKVRKWLRTAIQGGGI
jgi:hypothetical protein